MKKVKCGDNYKLVLRQIYVYSSIKSSLAKLYNRRDFHEKFEQWRTMGSEPDLLSNIYDGQVWKDFQYINGKPLLQQPYNLCLKLNVDWIQPFDHTQYSMGVIYLAIENLPKNEWFKMENMNVVGCIPGPKDPKGNIN